MANIFSNLLFGSEAAKKAFSTAAESVETAAAETANTELEAGEGDLEKFFGDYAEEQRAANAKAEAVKEAERTSLLRQYASSFKDRILREIQYKDWDKLVRSYERSSDEEDLLTVEVASLYNDRIIKSLPPQWWEKRAPELRNVRDGEFGPFEILLQIVRSEVSQKANVRRQAAASNLLKQVKAACEEIGLSEAEYPHKPLGAEETNAAAVEIGRKCLTLAVARAIRKNLLSLRDLKVRISKEADQAFYLISSSRKQKWGVIVMATRQLINCWRALEEELCSRPGAPVKKLKEMFFTITLEERAAQVAGHCHLDVRKEIANILQPQEQGTTPNED